MWVQMLITISGGRADGTNWPDRYGVLEVPDHEGRDLIRARHAIPADPPAVTAGPGTARVTAAAAPVIPEQAAAVPEGIPEPAAAVPVPAETPAPGPADLKAAWVDYAVSQGTDRGQAEAMTKADLMSRYGGRL
jgi:hypothetical protein